MWRNTVAWNPTVLGTGYQTFFAQVRAVNLTLQPDERIRVWLSEPPIDWSSIRTKDSWQRIYDQRDSHAAAVIVKEILERGKKALVIYGVGHFLSFPWPSTMPEPAGGTATLREIVDGRKLRFDVEVREGDRTIGLGTHERRIVGVETHAQTAGSNR